MEWAFSLCTVEINWTVAVWAALLTTRLARVPAQNHATCFHVLG